MRVVQIPMTREAFEAVANAHGVKIGGDYLADVFEITVIVGGQPTKQLWTRHGEVTAIVIKDDSA